MQLVKFQNDKLIRGKPYMAFVMVVPYYGEGKPEPVMLRFNELHRKEKKPEQDKQQEHLVMEEDGEQLL